MSTIPPAAQQAVQNALNAVIDAENRAESTQEDSHSNEEESGQVLEVASLSPADVDRTVFDDPKSFNVKHPLYSSWTLWFDSPNTKGKFSGAPSTPSTAVPPTPSTAAAQGWMDDIKKVISLDSVEEFWGLHNNIMPPSHLGQKANYYLFKEGIIPAWEDSANKDGGKWSIQLPRDKTREKINQMWLHTMLAAIGETFDPALSEAAKSGENPPQSIITGVIVSARPTFYRLSIWTRLAASPNSMPETSADMPPSEQGEALLKRIEAIGKHFKTFVLGFQEGARLAGPMSTDVEFISHKDSERKPKAGKKWII